MQFRKITPPILYVGTPVALITTVDDKGNANIGPMSSAWALGWAFVLGLGCTSKTFQNLVSQKQCVINFPASHLFTHVEKIAHLTGANPVPDEKKEQYQYSSDKFTAGNFSSIPSENVIPPRIAECPIQLEAVFKDVWYITGNGGEYPDTAAVCVQVVCVHAAEELVVKDNHIDPAKWDPLIYNFRHYQGLGPDLGKTFKAKI